MHSDDNFDIHATWIHMLIPARIIPASPKWVNELWKRRQAASRAAGGGGEGGVLEAHWHQREERRGEISDQPMFIAISEYDVYSRYSKNEPNTKSQSGALMQSH